MHEVYWVNEPLGTTRVWAKNKSWQRQKVETKKNKKAVEGDDKLGLNLPAGIIPKDISPLPGKRYLY